MTTTPPNPPDQYSRLREQVDFLVRSCDAYDHGSQVESKRQAEALRALFHDTEQSRSIAGDAEGLRGGFLSTAMPHVPENLSKHGGLLLAKAPEQGARGNS